MNRQCCLWDKALAVLLVAASSAPGMFKRYTYNGGVCDPLVISWPKGIKAREEVRDQYHHVTDIVPTILDCCGVKMPKTVDGVDQVPLVGTSMRYTFDDAKASTKRVTQYYESLGDRIVRLAFGTFLGGGREPG